MRALEELIGGSSVAWPAREGAEGSAAAPASLSPGGTAEVFPVFGKALLAIAGAYFLRALTELGALPLTVGVFAGIVYALAWLVLAARAALKSPFVCAVRGVTSALILAPLLWEATVRFHALSTWTAAGVLVVFSSLGFAVSWRSNLAALAWITTLAGLLTAIALLLATHDVAPLTLAVLAMTAAVECSACFGHWLGERWMVALVSDLTVLLLIDIAARGGVVPDGYTPIPAALALAALMALPAIYLSSTSVRALWSGASLSAFETVQLGVALLLSMNGVVRIGHGRPEVVEAVSVFALFCGALFYAFSFGFCRRTANCGRNFYTYSTLGLLLVLVGSRIQFSGAVLALILSALALLALSIGRRASQVVLRWHAAACLLFAAALSGLPVWAAARLLGARYGWMPLPAAAWIAAAATLLAYPLTLRSADVWSSSQVQTTPVLAIAASGAWSLAGLAAGALSALCAGAALAPFCSTLRTFVLTALAILLAFGGTAWKRRELVWLVYPFMALIACKLLVYDLPQGQTLPLFASLLLYGGALVLLPRVLQKSKRE